MKETYVTFSMSVLSFNGRIWVRDDNHVSVLSGFQVNLYPFYWKNKHFPFQHTPFPGRNQKGFLMTEIGRKYL